MFGGQKVNDWFKPRVLKEGDFDEVVASQACFARKFSETQSGQLIRLLHERISDRG